MEEPQRGIRAAYAESTITVYQAYRPEIGLAAARDGRFPAAWKRDRMTWIKLSFLWMMYRCGWGTKAGQGTVLAVEISRDGFEWALRHACLSSYVRGVRPDRATWQRQLKRVPARVQWDPERDLGLQPLPYRSLQLGLAGEAVRRYADERTVAIRDMTPLTREIHALVSGGDLDSAARPTVAPGAPIPRSRRTPCPPTRVTRWFTQQPTAADGSHGSTDPLEPASLARTVWPRPMGEPLGPAPAFDGHWIIEGNLRPFCESVAEFSGYGFDD